MLTFTTISEKSIQFILENKPESVIIAQELTSEYYESNIQKIRKVHPSIIIVLLTSNPFAQMEKLGRKWGADYILDKSSDFDKLSDLFQNFQTAKSF